jgi:exopolysaccharide production protein ExoQ
LATFVVPLAARTARRGRVLLWAGAIAAAVALVRTESVTGLLVALLMLTLPMIASMRRHMFLLITCACLSVVAIGLVAVAFNISLDSVLGAFGRDATLTGRTPLWSAVLDMIALHPWLGWGFSSFWLGLSGAGSGYVLRHAGWNAGYAHNGFLDVALTLGAVGVVALTWILVVATIAAARWFQGERHAAVALFPIGFMVFLLLANLTEGGIAQQNYYMWLILVTLSALLRRVLATTPALARTGRARQWIATVSPQAAGGTPVATAQSRPATRTRLQ